MAGTRAIHAKLYASNDDSDHMQPLLPHYVPHRAAIKIEFTLHQQLEICINQLERCKSRLRMKNNVTYGAKLTFSLLTMALALGGAAIGLYFLYRPEGPSFNSRMQSSYNNYQLPNPQDHVQTCGDLCKITSLYKDWPCENYPANDYDVFDNFFECEGQFLDVSDEMMLFEGLITLGTVIITACVLCCCCMFQCDNTNPEVFTLAMLPASLYNDVIDLAKKIIPDNEPAPAAMAPDTTIDAAIQTLAIAFSTITDSKTFLEGSELKNRNTRTHTSPIYQFFHGYEVQTKWGESHFIAGDGDKQITRKILSYAVLNNQDKLLMQSEKNNTRRLKR